jgi:hypothetical protein
MELKPVKVQADLFWAFLDTPNQMSGKYQVDLCNLSKEAIKTLEGMGVNVRKKAEKPEQGFFITAKSSNYPIVATDTNGNPIKAKVANGSKGVALLKPYEYTYRNQKGVGVGINGLVITDLIEYNSGGASVEDTADVL